MLHSEPSWLKYLSTCKPLKPVHVVFGHFFGAGIYCAECLPRLLENWLLFPNLCALIWAKHFNSPSFFSIIRFVFLAKGNCFQCSCTWQSEPVSWAVTSVLHNARSDILKRAGQWESSSVCAGPGSCLFQCDKAPPKIRAWCTETQRQTALKVLCASQRVEERKDDILFYTQELKRRDTLLCSKLYRKFVAEPRTELRSVITASLAFL